MGAGAEGSSRSLLPLPTRGASPSPSRPLSPSPDSEAGASALLWFPMEGDGAGCRLPIAPPPSPAPSPPPPCHPHPVPSPPSLIPLRASPLCFVSLGARGRHVGPSHASPPPPSPPSLPSALGPFTKAASCPRPLTHRAFQVPRPSVHTPPGAISHPRVPVLAQSQHSLHPVQPSHQQGPHLSSAHALPAPGESPSAAVSPVLLCAARDKGDQGQCFCDPCPLASEPGAACPGLHPSHLPVAFRSLVLQGRCRRCTMGVPGATPGARPSHSWRASASWEHLLAMSAPLLDPILAPALL